ncbi:hypothetical protein [Cupriavidus alkaliphilus]|uniref:hypothetical protein n=1 Tax=Cupriavidus alkaliphilus TaxID=942866 RepID=UPI00160FCD8E|nr:hypothetical protein [Cupriavidus alkaliphilus]MBB3012026.1 hypothetical protein [Cupriavidus alkaliphilus]
MKTYVRIDGGVVVELIRPMVDEDGKDVPIEARYHPDFVATLVDVTDITPIPVQGDVYADGEFTKPEPLQESGA